MANEVTVSQQTSPPGVYTTPTVLAQLAAFITALLTATIFMKLFSNEITITAGTALTDLTEAAAPGYAPIAITTINGPYQDQSGNAYAPCQQALFTCSGGGEEIEYGGYLVQKTGDPATVTFTLTDGEYTVPVIGSGGSGYLVPPRVTVTGETGTGAVLTATITAGVVTAINIVSAGSGYTTATATIEPPLALVEAFNFPTPLPLQSPTDAVCVNLELDNLATVSA